MIFAPAIALILTALALGAYGVRPQRADVPNFVTQRAAACVCAAAALFVVGVMLLIVALWPA